MVLITLFVYYRS